MKKLIILSGSSNTGKTETLKNLITILHGTLIPNQPDVKCLCKKNNLQLAICTAGDYIQIINDNITFLSEYTL